MLAYDEGKSVKVKCIKCGSQYWVWKLHNRAIVTKEREDD